jgi:formamidopyrimidine-DNA glycosylase
MPELPEAEAMRVALSPHALGRTITRVWVAKPWIRSLPPKMTSRLRSSRIIDVSRHGKAITLGLDNDSRVTVRLGMSGRLVARPVGQKHDLVALDLNDGGCLVFNDFRRFGRVSIESSSNPESRKSIGPDALTSSFSTKSLPSESSRAIKSVLIDQSIVAGLGNIYSCESLFEASIDPRRKAHSLTPEERTRLVASIKSILRAAIRRGGSTLDDYRGTEGEAGDYDSQFAVFRREGKPCPNCRCSTGVKRLFEGGRSTYFCPVYQK